MIFIDKQNVYSKWNLVEFVFAMTKCDKLICIIHINRILSHILSQSYNAKNVKGLNYVQAICVGQFLSDILLNLS